MKRVSVLVVASAICAASLLGGCAQWNTLVDRTTAAYDVLTSATVSPKAVIVAASTFDALEVTATNYLRLRRCNGANGPVCRDPEETKMIVASVRAGRVARNNLKQFLRDHPGALGPQGLYDALSQANSTLEAALAKYRAGTN